MREIPVGLPIDLLGKYVDVYRKLKTSYWSIRYNGLVVAHVEHCTLHNVTLHVSGSGRQRVRQQQQREVHAWARGVLTQELMPPTGHACSYNPYHERAAFYLRADNEAAYRGWAAEFRPNEAGQPEMFLHL